jgi:predicted PurR-regulated permease PerM
VLSREVRIAFWLAALVAAGLLLHLLEGVLLPFVAGLAIAYVLDPAARRLEGWGLSRTLATLLLSLLFFAAAVGLLLLLAPLLQAQVLGFAARLPGYAAALRAEAEPAVERLLANLPPEAIERVRAAAGAHAGDAVKWAASLLAGLWQGGMAFVHVLSLVAITPVVAFYLLRDWSRVVERLDGLLPRGAAPAIREQALALDAVISSFLRGQATVCLALAAYYGIALSLIGLEFGLLVGVAAGLVSFVPYAGAALGFAVGAGIAYAQFATWAPLAWVAAAFAAGQILEGYVLTPRLVGDRVGLHPVWIIFALLAGGALFGFTGLLLAVPAAAAVGVLVRFAVRRYRGSALYRGDGGEGNPP